MIGSLVSSQLMRQARWIGRNQLWSGLKGPSVACGQRRGFFSLPGRETAEGRQSGTHFGIVIVPQQSAYLIERFGKFHATLNPGIHLLIPFVDRISYIQSLKEDAVPVPDQTAITKDNVNIHIDGVLYIKVSDPYMASYGVESFRYAITQLAQTTMRSELGKLSLDGILSEREMLNEKIVKAINQASRAWGVDCLRYEIRDVVPPQSIRNAMDRQAEAERRKRAEILQSEGEKLSEINVAEGKKQAKILGAQADSQGSITRAQGTAEALRTISAAIAAGGDKAVSLRVAEQYVEAFSKLAKTSNSLILPASLSDTASMVSGALSIFKKVSAVAADATSPAEQKPSLKE